MPGDELHEEATGSAKATSGARRERTGPRHAAPRKPFLTRLHMPAGKAVAIAAMPSAVLMSMGVTPQLAYAKPLPKNPFGDGPCVSQEDRAEEDAREEAAAEAERRAEEAREREEAERRAEKKKEREQQAAQESESSASGGSGESSTGGTDGSGQDSGGSSEPEPEPSTGEDSDDGLLGGLLGGLGDTLSGGGEKQQSTDASAEPSPSSTPDVSAEDATDPVRDTVDDARKGLDDTVGKVEDSLGDATDGLPETPEDEAEGSSEPEETDQATGEDGERAFPCVEEKKVDGKDEQTPATLPNQPWTLKASSLTIRGQDYEGVYNIRTADGRTKQVLKFTADSVDIGDLHQIVQGPDGLKYHVKAAAGSTSTIRNGQVTMYTERLEGKLFGLIPIVFDPEHPPPLNIPDVYFTDVTAQQAGQFGGTLTVPGLTSTITDG